ncbi:MAG: hypothetical protein JW994_01475 [Candidatus Omnitrophica bacterium]|nr:hypothetical protein [Candidatus Omnitrophota bacterium]
MKGIIAALFCSSVCVAAHFIFAYLGLVKTEHGHPIRKLIYHWKLLFAVSIALLPVFLGLFYFMEKKGGFFNILESSLMCQYLYGLFFFAMLFFLYLSVYYVFDRSVSSRIMIEIENSPGKKLTFEQLKAAYDADTKYLNELKGMMEGGFVSKYGSYYRNTIKGAMVGKLASFYKRIFRLGKGG